MSTPHRDLCSTCARVPTCSSRGTPAKPVNSCASLEVYADLCTTCQSRGMSRRPVFYCEEFDAGVPVVADIAPWTPTRETPRSFWGVGLCADCENRETCVVPKPEGGIWTCEAYQ
jgi:hypothetical protein